MKSEKGGVIGVILIIVFIIFAIVVFSSSGNSNTGSSTRYDQERTLKDAYNKSKNGDTLTEREQRELDSYRKWEKKTYGNNI